MKRAIVVFVTLVIIFIGLLTRQLDTIQAGSGKASYPPDATDTGYEQYDEEDLDVEETGVRASAKKKKLIKVDTKEDSVSVLVNRRYRLSEDYIPADLVVPNVRFSYYGVYEKSYLRKMAASALEQLFEAAAGKGITLKAVSGYRSYARQMEIYNRNVSSRGTEKTDMVSAKPGSSEHQTGLAVDVSSDAVGCALEEIFGDTADGRWLAKNCHRFGFIIRYPKGKLQITGYSYEPWHIRYVGKNLATYLYKNDLTLEEYYQTTTVDQKIKNPEGKIHDVAEDDKDEPQMTVAPTPNPARVPASGRTYVPAATRRPSSASTATEAPDTRTPAAKNPATKNPATKNPATKDPATKKPAATEQPKNKDPETAGGKPEGTEDSSGAGQAQRKPAGGGDSTGGQEAQEQDTTVETTEETTEAQPVDPDVE